jgi:hypothetical protein
LDARNGNNTNFLDFDVRTNPNLTCIQVDDSTYSANNWLEIDAGVAAFREDCQYIAVDYVNSINNVSVYPNPATKNITLNFGKFYQEVNIEVVNLRGQIVLNKTLENNSSTTLELEGAAGVYFVRIQTEEGSVALKVIKE